MEPIKNATVYIVDDDSGVRDALAWLLRSRRLTSETFDSAEAFDARVSPPFSVQSPSCVLLDVRMAALSGLALMLLLGFDLFLGLGLGLGFFGLLGGLRLGLILALASGCIGLLAAFLFGGGRLALGLVFVRSLSLGGGRQRQRQSHQRH